VNSYAASDILSPDYSLPSYRRLRRPSISVEWPEDETLERGQGTTAMSASIMADRSKGAAGEANIDSAELAKIDSAFASAVGELKRYFAYRPRWDGYFAQPFEPEVLTRAFRILSMARRFLSREEIVPSLMTTGPASDGSLDVEIRGRNRTLFYTLYPRVDVEITALEEGAAPIRRTVPFEEMALARGLDWLAGKGNLPSEMEDN